MKRTTGWMFGLGLMLVLGGCPVAGDDDAADDDAADDDDDDTADDDDDDSTDDDDDDSTDDDDTADDDDSGPNNGAQVMGYILEMAVGGAAALDDLDYTAVDVVIHAFVNADANTAALEGVGSFDTYRNAGLADKVHAANRKIVMSIGGANHSWGMKVIAADPVLTDTFADNVVDAINSWGYDGVDIDLEFPWGGEEPQQHLNLVRTVYERVKANDPDHLVLFGVSPGYLLTEYVWDELDEHSDYAVYFCYDWANPANGPMLNPGQTLQMFGGDTIEASCKGALDYIVDHGYPADQIIVALPFYANGGAPWYSAPANADDTTPDPDYMEANVGGGWWTTPTAMEMKVEAVLDPASSVLANSATVAGVGFWEWGYEDPADPELSQAIKDTVQGL